MSGDMCVPKTTAAACISSQNTRDVPERPLSPLYGLCHILSSFCEGYVTQLFLMSFLCAILVSRVLHFCPVSQKSFLVRFRTGSFTSSRVLLLLNCFSMGRGIEYDVDFHGDPSS